jgi:hypothetical protein
MVQVGLLASLALAAVRCGQGGDGPATVAQDTVAQDTDATDTVAETSVAGVSGVERAAPELSVAERSADRFSGHWFTQSASSIEFESTRLGALSGDVAIAVGAVRYDVHYDFEAREVVADGHDGALDRPNQRLLRVAAEDVARYLGAAGGPPSAPRAGEALIEPMLYASLVLLADSGGMPLSRQVFRLSPTADVDKSLDDDGVTCIDRGSTYPVSFDGSGGTTIDAPVTADAEDCNGRCGPGCSALTPWAMWTLDCLEHDTCCGAGGDGLCWTPLGECGDEYAHAETDFLRGFDPLSSHCGG